MNAALMIPPPEQLPAIRVSGGCFLRTYRNLDSLESLRSDWDALLKRYSLATTFSTWEWLSCWWRAFGEGRSLLALALFDRDDCLVALASFSISQEIFSGVRARVLRLMGDGTYDSDNLDMPVVAGFEDTFARAIVDYLSNQKAQWDFWQLNTLPPESPMAACLSHVTRSRSWISIENATRACAIHLPSTWNEYLSMLSSEDGKNLPRYTRRLNAKYRTRIYRCDSISDLPGCLEALFLLHQGRWESVGERGSFSSVQRRNFYFELSAELLRQRRLELWVLEVNQEIVAVQFAFRFGDRVFQLQEGYDHRRSSDRFGYVLRGEVLRVLIQEGATVYDFLAGEDSYKTRWAARAGSYRSLRLAPRFSKGGLLLQISNRVAIGKQWLRRVLPEGAWSALRRIRASVHRDITSRCFFVRRG
ncbi:MAG TPA: GNAT family N-acetyltransferase [Terriglobales bacterium]|nr:GNAT family N-acetyltransferase [Terriglobales bacterium]